ncbi:MAG: flippase [Candidatus Omnitrophota bacterium]
MKSFNFNKQSLRKYFSNTSWLIGERILRIIVFVFVGAYVARFLGPDQYGVLNYAISFVALFSALAAAGLDSILVRELIRHVDKRDEILGTSFILRLLGSIIVFFIIALLTRFTKDDQTTNSIILIITGGLIFQSFNVLDYYFQSQVLSKNVVFAQIIQLIISSILKLVLIFLKAPLLWFAYIILLDSVLLASGLIFNYLRKSLSFLRWKINWKLSLSLMKDAWPLVLSGIAISIYMKIDQVMIKHMIGDASVGIYAVAVRLSEVWYFIPTLICGSLFPAILNSKKTSIDLYHRRLQELYALMFWIAVVVAIPGTLFAVPIIKILFGAPYLESVSVLRIYIWSSIFVFLGVANGKYLISENYTRIAFLRTSVGMISNVLLNLVLIKYYGIIGAAIATVISYFIATFFIVFIAKTRRQAVLMLKFIDFRIP